MHQPVNSLPLTMNRLILWRPVLEDTAAMQPTHPLENPMTWAAVLGQPSLMGTLSRAVVAVVVVSEVAPATSEHAEPAFPTLLAGEQAVWTMLVAVLRLLGAGAVLCGGKEDKKDRIVVETKEVPWAALMASP